MRDMKSEGGVKTGRMRSGNVDTTHTKWCATLTQKAKSMQRWELRLMLNMSQLSSTYSQITEKALSETC